MVYSDMKLPRNSVEWQWMVSDSAATLAQYSSISIGQGFLSGKQKQLEVLVIGWDVQGLMAWSKEGVSGFIYPYPASHSIRYHGRRYFSSCQNTSFISRANFSNSSASAKSSSWWIQVSHVTPFLQLKYCLREKVSNCIETPYKSCWGRTLLKTLGANRFRTATKKLKPP